MACHVRLFATPWTVARQASLSTTDSRSLLKLISIESVMPSSHLILCHPLPLLPSSFPSIRVFSNESALRIRRPKYWSFSFNISPSNEHSGLISFRMDWLDLLAVQGTQESSPTPQFKSIKGQSILGFNQFFQAHADLQTSCVACFPIDIIGKQWLICAEILRSRNNTCKGSPALKRSRCFKNSGHPRL